jgi:hypothetical protein
MSFFRAYLVPLLGLGLFTAAVACRSNSDGDSTSDDDGPGGSGSGANNAGGGQNTGGNGEGGIAGCEGPETTVQEITTGAVGQGAKVSVNGVVAMSHKWLVSHSKTSHNCLWGVFVSAPGLTETGPNTGMLVLSYGTKASIPEGQTEEYCPRLGQDPVGDRIPDNVKPGDVLDLVGVVDRFPDPPMCTAPDPANKIGMLQLNQVCKADLVGQATPPTPKTLSAAEIAKISSVDEADNGFHDQWGGVKVRIEDVGVTPEAGAVVGMYGIIHLANGVEVGDKLYYRGYSNNVCHEGPVFSEPTMTFDRVDGFHYLNWCTWGLQTNDKCADFAPRSEDCTADECTPDFLQ